jgi:hypothetical protein
MRTLAEHSECPESSHANTRMQYSAVTSRAIKFSQGCEYPLILCCFCFHSRCEASSLSEMNFACSTTIRGCQTGMLLAVSLRNIRKAQ